MNLRKISDADLMSEVICRVVQNESSSSGAVLGVFALLGQMAQYLNEGRRYCLSESLRDLADTLERQREDARV
jgi:hypothetical protein